MNKICQKNKKTELLFETFSKKWVLPILLYFLENEVVRFNDLKDSVEGMSAAVLSTRLTELEELGFITRVVKDGKPPVVEYTATSKTQRLTPIYEACDECC